MTEFKNNEIIRFKVKSNIELDVNNLIPELEKTENKSDLLFLNPLKTKQITPKIIKAINYYSESLCKTNNYFQSKIACCCCLIAMKKEFKTAIDEIGFKKGKEIDVLSLIPYTQAKQIIKKIVNPKSEKKQIITCIEVCSNKPKKNKPNIKKELQYLDKLACFVADELI